MVNAFSSAQNFECMIIVSTLKQTAMHESPHPALISFILFFGGRSKNRRNVYER